MLININICLKSDKCFAKMGYIFLTKEIRMNRFPMTRAGEQKLRAELDFLKNTKRKEIVEAIAEARAHGDLSENAEYDAAKEAQGMNEAKISSLEAQLQAADIIDVAQFNNDGKVIFGSTVTLLNCETDKEMKFQIVGDYEADISQQRLSVSSPIARGCIGRLVGDIVEVELPLGLQDFEIMRVEYLA